MAIQIKTDEEPLTPAQQDYVSYTACGGLLPSDEGAGKTMTAAQFANHWGVQRQTLYAWRKQIPDFWDRVAEARIRIGGKDRTSTVWNAMYLKAAGGSVEAAKLFLGNFDPNFKLPTHKVEVEAGESWAQLMQQSVAEIEAEPAERDTSEVLEGEIVPDHPMTIAEQINAARKEVENAANSSSPAA